MNGGLVTNMFITSKRSGYTRRGEQHCSGKFLVLFSHDDSMAEEEANTPVLGPPAPYWRVGKGLGKGECTCAGEPWYYAKSCMVHASTYVYPQVDGRKLYAIVRHARLRQLGHFMMGSISIGGGWKGYSLTVSGTYGGDGLPCSYEKVPPHLRHHLIEVPQAVADQYWEGKGGWNSAGSEAGAMRAYGLSLLQRKR
jgi:hypothetical protein